MAVCGSGSAVHHHHQAACYNHHNSSAVGSGSDDEYPPVASSLSRRPSFADIEFTGPVPAGRPLTLLLEGASLSRPPSALNTFPRSYHHHHHQGGPDARSSGRSMTAAASTNTLYARGSMRRGECYVHPQPPTIHYPQCLVHRKDYPSDDDDEPDPAYATGERTCARVCVPAHSVEAIYQPRILAIIMLLKCWNHNNFVQLCTRIPPPPLRYH